MYIELENGIVKKITLFRKAYKKSRWRKYAKRVIKRTLDYKPKYDGIIIVI